MSDHPIPDLDRQAIQRCRADLGPEYRALTTAELRETAAYKRVYLGLAFEAFKRALFDGLVAQFCAVANALTRPTPPEDQ